MKSEEFIEIPFNLKITNDGIDSIMRKALNEGILHWCLNVRQKYNQNIPIDSVISSGGRLLLYDMDESVYELSKGKFMLGLQQALPCLNDLINGDRLDASSIDFDGANLIIQLALFNELRFD